MPVEKLCASYVLRLTQRLSRLTFELHDVRTGRTHRFSNAGQLSCFLDAAATDGFPEPRPPDDTAAARSHHDGGNGS